MGPPPTKCGDDVEVHVEVEVLDVAVGVEVGIDVAVGVGVSVLLDLLPLRAEGSIRGRRSNRYRPGSCPQAVW